MPAGLSSRLDALVGALPVEPHSRVVEIGCGPGAAARAVAARLVSGHILATDRSKKAIAQVRASAAREIATGRLSARCVAVEELALEPDEEPFDIAFAHRVGALDGRHPELEGLARARIFAVLTSGGRLFVDGHESFRDGQAGPT